MPDNIEQLRAALGACPPGHSNQSKSLNNLASGLRGRFEQQGVLSDLDEAIDLYRAALAHFCKPDLSSKVSCLTWMKPLSFTHNELAHEFQSLTKGAGSSDQQLGAHKIVDILHELWEHIVSPIVKVLRDLIPRGSRIWWCPTAAFALLPLHAAGPYAKKSHNLSHFYISYTPTLTTLIRARQQVVQDISIPHFVAIG
ncbi:hypothetical protein AZE42_12373 [Rhizopogon vesiculosus]|uniref:Uncharacterized protein n=1 Tax=Rhizopogon vesiculosus TaxID=180088 RepID=A0A1J8PQV5_9AGAM|nr:hypothetical protein AZE42_12373 [Rhizopogon vesiculosus]